MSFKVQAILMVREKICKGRSSMDAAVIGRDLLEKGRKGNNPSCKP